LIFAAIKFLVKPVPILRLFIDLYG